MGIQSQIKDLIFHNGVSLTKLSILTGIPRGTIANWRYTKTDIPLNKVEILLNTLGYDIDVVKRR